MTDWDINMFTEAVTGLIGILMDNIVPTVSIRTYPNQKPWFNMAEYKKASYALRRAVKEAKQSYRDKLKHQFQQHDTGSTRRG